MQSSLVARGLELLTFAVRATGDAGAVAEAVRAVVREVEPAEPVANIQPLEQYVSDQLGGFRQYALLLAIFGMTAVVLAVIGAFGLMGMRSPCVSTTSAFG